MGHDAIISAILLRLISSTRLREATGYPLDGEVTERYTDIWPTLVGDLERSIVHVAAKVFRIGRKQYGPEDPVKTVG